MLHCTCCTSRQVSSPIIWVLLHTRISRKMICSVGRWHKTKNEKVSRSFQHGKNAEWLENIGHGWQPAQAPAGKALAPLNVCPA